MSQPHRSDAEIAALVEQNMALAVHIAKQYQCALGWQEAISAAQAGLLNAARMWIPEKGKFGTYAGISIRRKLSAQVLHASRLKRGGGSITIHVESGHEYGFSLCDSSPRPDTIALKNDDFAILNGLLLQLPRHDRFLITARYLRDRPQTFDRLGAQLHITKQAVHGQCKRILKTLRKLCAKEMGLN